MRNYDQIAQEYHTAQRCLAAALIEFIPVIPPDDAKQVATAILARLASLDPPLVLWTHETGVAMTEGQP